MSFGTRDGLDGRSPDAREGDAMPAMPSTVDRETWQQLDELREVGPVDTLGRRGHHH
jgi:hypothetical protein